MLGNSVILRKYLGGILLCVSYFLEKSIFFFPPIWILRDLCRRVKTSSRKPLLAALGFTDIFTACCLILISDLDLTDS